jgi:hypothetical protein
MRHLPGMGVGHSASLDGIPEISPLQFALTPSQSDKVASKGSSNASKRKQNSTPVDVQIDDQVLDNDDELGELDDKMSYSSGESEVWESKEEEEFLELYESYY